MYSNQRTTVFLSGLIGTLLSVTFWLQLINLFSRSNTLFSVELYLGVALFSAFVMYDTQLIIRRSDSGDKDYLQHSFDLYLDFVSLFVRILIILAKNAERNDKKDKRRR